MENILILNIGSSSIKYDLFSSEEVVLKGYVERVKDLSKGLKKISDQIKAEGIQVGAVGHRVVHGGAHSAPVLLDAKKIKELEKISEFAPLHNIPEVKGIKACKKIYRVPHVAVFDTAFHSTIPSEAYTYAIPSEIAAKHKIRRYGFHGTSHKYVAREAAHCMQKSLSKTKIITCHLGNGCSVTAVKKGESVDTSMGFTPLEGLVMGTRSGDMDPAIVCYLQHKEKKNWQAVEEMLNKKSGLLGISGHNDMRDIYRLANQGNKKARLALDIFCYRLVKYIGGYIAAMDGVDAIVFTGGIGENAWWVREQVLSHFAYLGLRISKKANRANDVRISSFASRVWCFVIPTKEELMMCREVRLLLGR